MSVIAVAAAAIFSNPFFFFVFFYVFVVVVRNMYRRLLYTYVGHQCEAYILRKAGRAPLIAKRACEILKGPTVLLFRRFFFFSVFAMPQAYFLGIQVQVRSSDSGQEPQNPGWVYTMGLHT